MIWSHVSVTIIRKLFSIQAHTVIRSQGAGFSIAGNLNVEPIHITLQLQVWSPDCLGRVECCLWWLERVGKYLYLYNYSKCITRQQEGLYLFTAPDVCPGCVRCTLGHLTYWQFHWETLPLLHLRSITHDHVLEWHMAQLHLHFLGSLFFFTFFPLSFSFHS